jgi:hypothetical protein
MKQLQKRWAEFGTFARRAPYASGLLMLAIALYMGISADGPPGPTIEWLITEVVPEN